MLKNFWIKKNFRLENFFETKKVVPKHFWAQINYGSRNIFIQKLESNRILSKKKLGLTNYLGQKHWIKKKFE